MKKPSKEKRVKVKADTENLGIGLLDIVFPVMLPIKGVHFIASKLSKMAEEEITDKSKVHEELLDLQMRFEMGEISEEEYNKKEEKILEKLEAIRKYEEEKERG